MSKSNSGIRLSGREAALLVGALFALAEWPFEQPAAKALMTKSLRERAQLLSESTFERWRTRLREAGLWGSPSGLWTRELIEQRGVLPDGLVIAEAESELAVTATPRADDQPSGVKLSAAPPVGSAAPPAQAGSKAALADDEDTVAKLPRQFRVRLWKRASGHRSLVR